MSNVLLCFVKQWARVGQNSFWRPSQKHNTRFVKAATHTQTKPFFSATPNGRVACLPCSNFTRYTGREIARIARAHHSPISPTRGGKHTTLPERPRPKHRRRPSTCRPRSRSQDGVHPARHAGGSHPDAALQPALVRVSRSLFAGGCVRGGLTPTK